MAKAPAPRKPTTAENLQAVVNNPNVRKFLDMLSAMEGTTKHGYNTTFGGGRVESLESHPNIQREFRQTDGKTNSSGAAGRYQFLDKTWRTLQQQYPQNISDFGQQSQDFGAVALIANRGALNDVVSGRFGTAVKKVGAEWASLPTSPYPQRKGSWDDVNKALGLQVPAGGAKAANAQALTPEQGKKLYDVYKAGRMSPEQQADYERDFASIQKPAGATMLRSAGGTGVGGSTPAPAPAQAVQAAAKAAPYVLPVEIIMAYNDGSMNPEQRSEFERDYKAGVIAAPRHIPFKLQETEVPIDQRDYTGNRTGQFLDQSGQALGNFGKAVLGDGPVDAATAPFRAVLGAGQAFIQGAGGMAVEGVAGLSGIGAGAQAALTGGSFVDTAAGQINYTRDALQPLIPQAYLAPDTTAAAAELLGIPMYGTQAFGNATYDQTGNAGLSTMAQASGDALLMTLGLGKVGKTPAPTARAMPSNYVPTQQFTSPNPLQAASNFRQTRNPVAQSAAASMGREVPIPVQPVREDIAPAEPLATNPADLAAQAEAMPRPDDARPATTLTPDSPTVTIQPDGVRAATPDPITDPSPTNRPINEPAAAGTITTVGDGGLSVMHGSTRADLTADQVQVFSPNAKQGKRRKDGGEPTRYGGFYATTDNASAQRYADMGKEGSVPTVYDVQIKAGSNILDSAGDITRLSESAIAQHRANGVDVVRGKDPRGQVEYAIINPEAVGGLTPRAKPAAPKTTQGKAFTTSNKPVNFEYDVVPIESVVKSTNADLTPNTAARREMQPRDRDSDASTAQINTIANTLNPERLGESPTFDTGAPVILGSEAVAGHGRLAAIERRYGQGAGAEYRAFVAQKAAELGIDPARMAGVERPVLVRRVKDDADAQMIAQDSNAPTTLRMTTGEQARIDAKALPDLGKLKRGEDGEMNIPSSHDFIRDFMSALPIAERGDLMTADGRISQNAVRRIQAAVSEKAYQDADLIARFTEAADADGKRISAALQKQAGAVAALAEAAAKGERYPTAIGADLAQAANKYADIKATGLTVKNYLDQGKLVDDGLSAGAIEALTFFGENANSGVKISEYIQGKIAEVEAKGNPMQDSLFQSPRAQKEAEAVRRQYEGTPQWMQAPDGTPTKLSEQQWVQVRTPSFKEWFGDWENNPKGASKVVDENGEPMAVYHGTKAAFDTFKSDSAGSNSGNLGHYGLGHYFSRFTEEAAHYGSKTMGVFLDIKNPFRDTDQAAIDKIAPKYGFEKEAVAIDEKWLMGSLQKADPVAASLADSLQRLGSEKGWEEFFSNHSRSDLTLDPMLVMDALDFVGKDRKRELTDWIVEDLQAAFGEPKLIYDYVDGLPPIHYMTKTGQNARSFTKDVQEMGFDGVLANSELVAFDNTQIKSATANSGAFDGSNPNIYKQSNKPQAAGIGERIAEQAKAAGRPAKEAKQAGKLAEAYYAATAKALGLTPDEVFAKVGLTVESGDVGGANAALKLGATEHAMVFGENANASSFVHESGHHFLETHAKLADESPKLQADVDAVMTWAGHDGRAWSDLSKNQKRETHEKFAESFEQYLLTGKAPTKGLKKVFEDFKKWMTDVYTSLTEFSETNPRADLSPEIIAVMDRMLGGKADKVANAKRSKKRKQSAPVNDALLDFKRSVPVAGGVSPSLHQDRYNILRDIGLTDDQIRGGSVEGDIKRLEWDTELSKYDTDYGVKMKEQLELERQKLREYGDGVVESMGGTAKATPETRGAAIVRPLEAYQAWYREQIKAFYKLADEQGAMTGGIELRALETKLKEDSVYHNEPLQGMRKSVRSFLFEQRLLDDRGNIKPMSAKQAETVRKHLNSIRTFETGRVISELNALIDGSVFSTLNRSVYGEARAVNTQYHRIFSNPKGIAKLLDVDGINRKISHEKVAANVAALAETDAAQFRHIMKQLEDMPTPELQKMADQAIGEIRAQIAEKITAYDSTKPETVAAIGKALAPYRGAKLREIFGEDGAQKLETFVAAHGILRRVDAQPSGTSSMGRNIVMKVTEVGAALAGGSAGLTAGGAYGGAMGTIIGQQVGAKIKTSMVAAIDKRSYGKAMSPRQLETMKQSYDASGRRLAALPETEAATAAASAEPNSTRARVTNARLERTKQWIDFHSKLTDEQKSAAKKIGAAAWLLSVSGLSDNQTNNDGENR